MTLKERVTFANSRGQRLAGILHHPAAQPSAAVILCHGMESNKESEKLVNSAGLLYFALILWGEGN